MRTWRDHHCHSHKDGCPKPSTFPMLLEQVAPGTGRTQLSDLPLHSLEPSIFKLHFELETACILSFLTGLGLSQSRALFAQLGFDCLEELSVDFVGEHEEPCHKEEDGG